MEPSCFERRFESTDFHVIYGSTSEHRLPDFMRDGGSKMTGGQAARFVDLPADAGHGFKIFESLPRKLQDRQADPDVDSYLHRLNQACQSYYGVAGQAYLRLSRPMNSRPIRSTLEAFLRKAMTTFETEVANDAQVDPRIRRRYAGLYAAGQLGLRCQVLHPRCDWFMEAMSSCYRAAISPDSTSSLSAAEAAARLAKFLRANRDRLLKRSGERDITRSAYREAIGLRPDQTYGKRTWLKSSVFRDSIFSDGTDSALGRLVTAEVILKLKAGLVAQQQRVPGVNIKEYFYVIDSERLRALNGGNGHS